MAASNVVEPTVVRVVPRLGVQPPMIPEGLKVTVLKDPSTLEPAADCPVVKWGDYTYWPFSYVDNRYAMCLVAYDSSTGSKGAALKQWELNGARYVVSISVDASLQRITLLGQSSDTVSASWADIGKVVPTNPQYFWILHKASRLACSAPDSRPSSSIPLQEPDVADRQLWLFDNGRQAIFPKSSYPQLDFCLDRSDVGSDVLLAQTNWGRAQQRWIIDVATQNLKPVTSSLVADKSDSNTMVLQPRSAGSVSQLWQPKPFIPLPDLSADQFPLLVPDQPFALSSLDGFLLKSTGQGNPLVTLSQSLVKRDGLWLYKHGYGGVVNVDDGLAITSSGGSIVTASPWTGRPQQQWVLNTNGYLVCRANNGVLTSNSDGAGGTVALASFDPLDRVDQRWFLQFSPTATKRAKRSIADMSKVDRITKLTVTAKVASDFFAGTIDYIYITLGDGSYRQLLLKSPARGDSATISIDMQSMFGKPVINPYEDITQVLLYQNEQGPVFSDDWKLESIILKATTDDTKEEFTNYTFQKIDKWLHVSRWKEPFTWYKLAWSAPVPWGAWLDASQKPIDLNCQTYSVNWQPYIGDLKSWRTYDPSQIDGVGYLIGIRNGKLIGELLKTKQTEVLQLSDDRHSYTWVFSPSGALIYKLWDKHNPADYVRHSQLGKGDPVICAGEMQMTKVNDNYVPSDVIAMVNDASGHYKPDGGACLRYVGQKLQELGIPTEQIKWYSR